MAVDTYPRVVILAGPNGAGKSTVASRLLQGPLKVDEFVNADTIAQGLSAFHAEGSAIAAGRIMLARLRQLAVQRISFGFETTLASRSFVPFLKQLIASGYACHLVFLWLPSVDAAIARVRQRVQSGGHSVPEETIRRRYIGGLQNFMKLYQPLAMTWQIVDNGTDAERLTIATGAYAEVEQILQPQVWNQLIAEFCK